MQMQVETQAHGKDVGAYADADAGTDADAGADVGS